MAAERPVGRQGPRPRARHGRGRRPLVQRRPPELQPEGQAAGGWRARARIRRRLLARARGAGTLLQTGTNESNKRILFQLEFVGFSRPRLERAADAQGISPATSTCASGSSPRPAASATTTRLASMILPFPRPGACLRRPARRLVPPAAAQGLRPSPQLGPSASRGSRQPPTVPGPPTSSWPSSTPSRSPTTRCAPACCATSSSWRSRARRCRRASS
jgi:hypothetical protein